LINSRRELPMTVGLQLEDSEFMLMVCWRKSRRKLPEKARLIQTIQNPLPIAIQPPNTSKPFDRSFRRSFHHAAPQLIAAINTNQPTTCSKDCVLPRHCSKVPKGDGIA
jgi:hypothetical protein